MTRPATREPAVSQGSASQGSASEEYRAHVGPADEYDVNSATQFNLLTTLGLRDHHTLLDIGCGSLRGGRLFISFLRPGGYYGLEPLEWLVEEGFAKEIGESIRVIKKPSFEFRDDYCMSAFGLKFDYMIAQSIFSHASQAQMRQCFAEAAKVMKPQTIFAATFFEGPNDYEGDRWIPKAEYSWDCIKGLVEEQGLHCERLDWAHPDLQKWFLVLHPESTVEVPEVSDTQRLVILEEQLAIAEAQLAGIRSHPYVRFGNAIKFMLVTLRFRLRAIRRALGMSTEKP